MVLSFASFIFLAVLLSSTSALFINLRNIENEMEKKYNLEFLKDFFKFHVYINPHPLCALEDESCSDDGRCCGGLECKMAVDREGVRYTCQGVLADGGELKEVEDWSLTSEESDDSVQRDIYRAKLEEIKREEEKLLSNQYYMIKELEKPLTLDEMRELEHVREAEDYKREKELKELRKWINKKKAEEEQLRIKIEELKKVAKERVDKVLREEERHNIERLNKYQEQKKKGSWI